MFYYSVTGMWLSVLMLKLDIVHFVKVMIHFQSLGVMRLWFKKVINVFCFRTKEKEKEKEKF